MGINDGAGEPNVSTLISLLAIAACAVFAFYDVKARRWGIGTIRVMVALGLIVVVLIYRWIS
jgi:hypothetical protein